MENLHSDTWHETAKYEIDAKLMSFVACVTIRFIILVVKVSNFFFFFFLTDVAAMNKNVFMSMILFRTCVNFPAFC